MPDGAAGLRDLDPSEIRLSVRPSLVRVVLAAAVPTMFASAGLEGGFRAGSGLRDHLIGSAIALVAAAIALPLILYGLRVRLVATDEWVAVTRMNGRVRVGGVPGLFGKPDPDETEEDRDWSKTLYGDDPPDMMDHCCRGADLRAIRIDSESDDTWSQLNPTLKFLVEGPTRHGGRTLQAAFTIDLGGLWPRARLREFAEAVGAPIADPGAITLGEAVKVSVVGEFQPEDDGPRRHLMPDGQRARRDNPGTMEQSGPDRS